MLKFSYYTAILATNIRESFIYFAIHSVRRKIIIRNILDQVVITNLFCDSYLAIEMDIIIFPIYLH